MGTVSFILLSTGLFTTLALLMVLVLILAEKNLVKSGPVKILINDDPEKSPTVPSGMSLLSALAANSIFLPSACGGRGTCALCKCQVLEGGGSILPTETGQINRREQKNNYRLACQVKVKNDLKIHIPDEIFNIKKFDCTVRSNRNVATFIKELDLELPPGETLKFKSGGYIQIDIPPYKLSYGDFIVEKEYRPDWDKFKLWDLKASNDEPIFRAYSMANHPAEGNRVMLNVRIATPPPRQMNLPPGIASSYIFNLKPGDKVTVSGPFGEFFIKDTDKEMIYIGGGAGMAPLRSHIMHLFHTLRTKRKVSYWYGARSSREMFYEEDFHQIEKEFPNFSFHAAMSEPLPEDNWKGPTGFIHTVVLNEYLSKHPDPAGCEYYLCGPPLMLKAVKDMLYNLGVEKDSIAYDEF